MTYVIDIIRTGWNKTISNKLFSSACTISLLRGSKLLLVDPGSPWDSNWLINELKTRSVDPEDLDYVICTHEHVDHVGSLVYFRNATRIIGTTLESYCQPDCYTILKTPFQLCDNIEIVSTPGHSLNDVSIIVKNINSLGSVAIVGDLFECEEDLKNPLLWKANSYNVDLQEFHRNRILTEVDYVIPGHGPIFKIHGHLNDR